MGFYFMEIMRKSQAEGKLERDFAAVLQSLDINQEQREEYEGVVNKFKAADEPQILALDKEESSNGSTKQAPEEMHAMNAETGGTDCEKCQRSGKDECWTHSSFHCSICDKRGKNCACERKKARDARGKHNGRRPQRQGAKTQNAPLEAMVAAMSEKINDLVQKGEEREKALSGSPEEAPMAQRKEVGFLDDDEIGGGSLEHFMFQTPADGLEHDGTAEEEGDESHNTRYPPPEHHFGSEFDDTTIPKTQEMLTRGDEEILRDNQYTRTAPVLLHRQDERENRQNGERGGGRRPKEVSDVDKITRG
jgi:hypothetical protein